MNYPSIRIEGAILSPDLIDGLDDVTGQRAQDFGFDSTFKVKDEIARAWADAQDYWRIFQRKVSTLKPGAPATTETRNLWMTPLLQLFGYQLDRARTITLNEKSYAISHVVTNRGDLPIHIIGYGEAAGLDRKPERSSGATTTRMSAHALVQELLNLSEQLYGLVSNGRVLRLLRDSSRLVKLSYLEFDLERIFSDGLFADFAILFRLLHVSRLPLNQESAASSLIERYHQDSLEAGARIRTGLSRAVEASILDFANGFLADPANAELRQAAINKTLSPDLYYQQLLRLIYRLLFLFVIEERALVFPSAERGKQSAEAVRGRAIYDRFYSLQRLRRMAEKRYLGDHRHNDLWQGLLATFRLFEAGGPGQKLNVAPLAGDLFDPAAIGLLNRCMLTNAVLLACLRSLSLYQHPASGQLIRVNYAALNVEEFGSVYEGLLEYAPRIFQHSGRVKFDFAQGDARAATGSHYTDDSLVQPLLTHSLDYLIADALRTSNPEAALLALRVADIACGSGHILLAAARRIALALATVRTGEEQPSPTAFRAAVRDVIRECIYGVDLNPLAVELCKVALWLEAHNPGEPLNFLDHHIKCGNAIVGFVRAEELDQGVPDEAFATLPEDDKAVAATLRKRNKEERTQKEQSPFNFTPAIEQQLAELLGDWRQLNKLPENNPIEIRRKQERYQQLTNSKNAWLLNQIAAIPIAQFYLPKTTANLATIITDNEFHQYWQGKSLPQGQATAAAWAMAQQKHFFHWFLEFPEIIERGGFDCILGNPPYLGGQDLSGTYGYPFCHYVKWQYAPAGLSDLVAYFVRRIYSLLRPKGFAAFITTNSIKDGDVRKDSLEQVLIQGGAINFAVRGIKWPGRANLVISLVALHKGEWHAKRILDENEVTFISAFLEEYQDEGVPLSMVENANQILQGSIFLGDGFLISQQTAENLIQDDPRNRQVIFPVINGQEINSKPDQASKRQIINFFDWPLEKAETFGEAFKHIINNVRQERLANKRIANLPWWQYERPRVELYLKIFDVARCFVSAATTKYLNFSAVSTKHTFSHALFIFTTDRWDIYTIVQSTIHEVWARKYSGALETRLRYSPSDCFETFAFPAGLWQNANPALATIGERYHEHRRQLMLQLWLGLTDLYNLFHNPKLSPALVAKSSKKTDDIAAAGYQGILELRNLHRQLDQSVLAAYGWSDLDLGHNFYEVETLSENDRTRYTISPDARKEVLRRLLALNHERAQEEAERAELVGSKSKKGGKKGKNNQVDGTKEQLALFVSAQ